MNLLDYGLGVTPTASVKTLASVGLSGDVVTRGIYPIPGETILVVTESGAFLYDKEFTFISAVRITNRQSQTAPFNEKSQDWTSECCSIPFYHMNPNRWGQEGHGFLVVRRTADVTITNEDRGSQGVIPDAMYAHWNIHFDPIDLSKPGPVVGEFHFQKTGLLSPDEFNLQEVTFLDGCSTSAFVEDHGDGYFSDPANGRYDFRYAEKQTINTKWAGVNLVPDYAANDPNTPQHPKKSRFWDSYAVFQVLIESRQQFFDWSAVDRSPSMGPPPEAVGCYLVFANAACRGPQDPPMKLIRTHYTSLQEAFTALDHPDRAGYGPDGSRIARMVAEEKLPRGIPYLPTRVMAPNKILWQGNFLYSNLEPGLYGGTTDNNWPWIFSTNPASMTLPVNGEWFEQIWVKWDSQFEAASSGSRPWNKVSWPNSFQVGGLLDSEWGCQRGGDIPLSARRKDICSMVATKAIEYVPTGVRWVPGMMASIVVEKGAWDASSNQRKVIDREADNVWAVSSVMRRYMLRVAGIVAPAQNDPSYFFSYASSGIAQASPDDTASRRPFVSLNPFRGWVTLRPLFLSTLAADASGCAQEIVSSVGAMTPYIPAGLQIVFRDPQPSSLIGSRAFFASADPYSSAAAAGLKAITSIYGTSLGQSAGSSAVASGITPLFGASAPAASVPATAMVSPLLSESAGASTATAAALVCAATLYGGSTGVSAASEAAAIAVASLFGASGGALVPSGEVAASVGLSGGSDGASGSSTAAIVVAGLTGGGTGISSAVGAVTATP